MITKNPNRTSDYQFSISNDDEGNAALKNFRRTVKIWNAEQKLMALRDPNHIQLYKRVATFGRLGKNNPKAHSYRVANRGWRNAYQRIRLEDAKTVDVYCGVYQKVTHVYGGTPFTSYRHVGSPNRFEIGNA